MDKRGSAEQLMKRNCAGLILVAALASGCYYDVEEELYPSSATACDTAGVNWTIDIEPLLSANCFSCHSAGTASGNVILEGYQNALVYANDGRLLGSVSHEPGYSAMPLGGNKISHCHIEVIRTWILNGTPEN